jgi:RNA polymerase primary sigma factor
VNKPNLVGTQRMSQLLRMAVLAGVESTVQIHIDRGDDLNARDANGMTPLMLCAVRDKPEICRLLLSAGADLGLLDPSGKTAIEIAIAAGSNATAAVLDSAIALCAQPSTYEIASNPAQEKDFNPPMSWTPPALVAFPIKAGTMEKTTDPETLGNLPWPQHSPALGPVVDDLDDGEFDLSGWETEEELTRPEADSVVLYMASAVQIAITGHEPIDASGEWEDIYAYLPEVALPLARAEDAEGRARLRLLLLRALREGSVPVLDVHDQSANDDRTSNPEAEAYLAMVINDLGAELDERFEYANFDESFKVFVDPKESPVEEGVLDEALAAIDRAASSRHEPLRIYQREFQRHQLLTADEEIRLAKDMEAALDSAHDALASWPDGIRQTLAAGAEAVSGIRALSSIWIGGEPDLEPATAEDLEEGELAHTELEDTNEDGGDPEDAVPSDAGGSTFEEALRRLAVLVESANGPKASVREIRQALVGLRLNRRYLLELIDAPNVPEPSHEFRIAMADFCKARDWMTSANLRLAFFQAKKFLYSGEPLDDLAQEGNIGLLKAVDRFDWRRGFRFSTYATWWIRQQIGRYVAEKVRTIRVPVYIHEKLQRADKIAKAFEATVGREPTLEELAERVEMPRHKLSALLRVASEPSAIDEATVDNLIAIDVRDTYMSPNPEEVVDEIQLNRAVDRYISSLTTKDRKEERILRMRFGIGTDEAMTLDEIGMRFDVSRERIRQIEAKAIKKLRHPVLSEPFSRMALGRYYRGTSIAPSAHQPAGDNLPSTEEAERALKVNLPLAPMPPRVSTQPSASSKPSLLDRLLTQAVELGIPVEDGQENASGRIWVGLVTTPDGSHRRLARKLLDFGFVYFPGKGYWK